MPSEKDGPEYTRKKTGDRPEYSLAATVDELQRWLYKGRSFYPVATAESAKYWLSRSMPAWDDGPEPGAACSLTDTVELLSEWLSNTVDYLPRETGELALYWLRRLQPPPSGGG